MKVINEKQIRMLKEECAGLIELHGIGMFTELLTHFDDFLASEELEDLYMRDEFMANLFVGFLTGWVCCINAARAKLH